MLKAYMVHPGESPIDAGCVLVFAESRNRARQHATEHGPWFAEYIHMRAVRRPRFDEWAEENTPRPYIIETNDDLPAAAPAFFDDRVF